MFYLCAMWYQLNSTRLSFFKTKDTFMSSSAILHVETTRVPTERTQWFIFLGETSLAYFGGIRAPFSEAPGETPITRVASTSIRSSL